MRDSDEQLVFDCRRGDQLAWEKLVQRYQRLIYTIPLRAGLDVDQAAEIFQDVFTTLFQKLDDLEEPERLQAWLVTTARRKTWRVISKAERERGVAAGADATDDSATSVRDETPLPEEQLLILEEQHRIRVAVSLLDERCRALVQMLFYSSEPPSYQEIAAALGIPEGSVGPTRARCLGKLLRMLQK